MSAVLSAELVDQLEQFGPVELINRKRSNLLIHSYLYYWCDSPIWTDDMWQKVADDLTSLQANFPDDTGFYDEAFKDWSGATGCHLPRDNWVIETATRVSRNHHSQNALYNKASWRCE